MKSLFGNLGETEFSGKNSVSTAGVNCFIARRFLWRWFLIHCYANALNVRYQVGVGDVAEDG